MSFVLFHGQFSLNNEQVYVHVTGDEVTKGDMSTLVLGNFSL